MIEVSYLKYAVQDKISDSVAETLLQAAPGLFVRQPNGKLTVTEARHHEKHLEKVSTCCK